MHTLDSKHKIKIDETFTHLIDTIKQYDDSIYFWIQGGALRRCLNNTLNFNSEIDYDEDWYWPVDIDIHYLKHEDGKKLSKILVEKMGFEEWKSYGNNTFYKFFDIIIDLIKPHGWEWLDENFDSDEAMDDYFVVTNNYKLSEQTNIKSSLIWAPFTIESIALDSEFDLYYHEHFSEDINNQDIRYINKDYKLIYDTIESYCKNKESHKIIKMFMDKAIIQTHYPYKFSLPKWKATRMKKFHIENDKHFLVGRYPRLQKHMDDGYKINKDEYIINKLMVGNLIDEVSNKLNSFKHTGWWQSSHYYGIVDWELKMWYSDKLYEYGNRFKKHKSMVETYKNIIKDTADNMNFIMKTNLKD
tara:strand:- start:418 stop:1491 length:1074 start_codon:yes stop_codon:yes gene_type:complete